MKWSGNINYLNKILQQFEKRLESLEGEVHSLKEQAKKPEPIKRGPGRPKKVVEDATE